MAVLGLGYFAQLHLEAWHANPDAALIGVADIDAKKSQDASERHACAGFSSLAELLDGAAPDILDLVVPPPMHAEAIRTAMGRVPIIVCQKPFCVDLVEAQVIVKEAKRAGSRLLIHENFRFQPWYRTLKQWLDAGQLGTVWHAQFDLRPGDGRGERAYLDRQPAFQTMPRLLVHETAVHFLDLLPWLLGDVVSIYADLRRLNPVIAGEDAGTLLLEHDSGARSVFTGNRLADHVAEQPRLTMGELRIEGERGTVRLDGYGALHVRRFGELQETRLELSHTMDSQAFGGGCVPALIDHLVSAALGRGAYENDASDYLKVVALSEAAYESAASGQKVRVVP